MKTQIWLKLIFVFFIFSFTSVTANAQDIEYTEAEQEVMDDFFQVVFKKYGRVQLRSTEWKEMHAIHPQGVELFASKANLSVPNFIELMKINEIMDKEEREKELALFEKAHPEIETLKSDMAEAKKKEEQERKETVEMSFGDLLSDMIEENKVEKESGEPKTAWEEAQAKALEEYAKNDALVGAMDDMFAQVNSQIDTGNINNSQPTNFLDFFKDGELKDGMVEGYSNEEFGGQISDDRNIHRDIMSVDNHIFKKLTANAVHSPAQAGNLYNEVLIRKGKRLINQRNYKKRIYLSQNKEWQNLLAQYQKELELYRYWTLNKKGYTMEEWMDSLTNVNVDEYEEKLFKAVPFSENEEFDWTILKEKLNSKEAAIEILRIADKQTIKYAFLILRKNLDAPAIVVLENGNELETNLLIQYNDGCNSHKLNSSLYSAYWEKVQEQLSGIEKMYISTDGVYNWVNINLFNSPINPAKYYIEDFEIQYVLSTQHLRNKNSNKKSRSANIALFGDVNFDHTSNYSDKNFNSAFYPQLKNAKEEISAIQAVGAATGTEVSLFTGEQASERIFKKQKAAILHIASHAFYNPKIVIAPDHNSVKNEMASFNSLDNFTGLMMNERENYDPSYRAGIAFAGANTVQDQPTREISKEDGIAFAAEIEHMDLSQTQLVFVNACESGKGDVSFGDGIYGLQRSFFSAGADCLILSQNKLEDKTSGIFAKNFYTNWLIEGKSKQEAFRLAQLKLKASLRRGTALYKWGSFMMIHY